MLKLQGLCTYMLVKPGSIKTHETWIFNFFPVLLDGSSTLPRIVAFQHDMVVVHSVYGFVNELFGWS
jgi:hypothetical protein